MSDASLLLIRQGRLNERCLDGEVVIVTGAGGGIGFEAARSLLGLGASVVIAEIDADACAAASRKLEAVAGADRVLGLRVDVGDEDDVTRLVAASVARFGKVDVVLNNATYAPVGAAVAETSVDAWDRSYAVNLRGPALLARACLPAMIERKHGVFVCVSSTGGPFLAPYETLKAAQVALASSLDAELAGTGVTAFTIGPGLVPTTTALAAIERIAPRLGTTVEDFWRTNKTMVVSVEAAGAGFAAAVAMAERYAGQETSSTAALIDAGITIPDGETPEPPRPAPRLDHEEAADAYRQVLKTLDEQAAGWKQRSFFERQWMQRDFKQRVGMPIERCMEMVTVAERSLRSGDGSPADIDPKVLKRLAGFYGHLGELAGGYVKDPLQRQQQVAVTAGWAAEVERLIDAVRAA